MARFNKKSFSLIELLITMALVAVVMTLTIPRTTFYARFLVQAEINKLYAICAYLQQRALASNESQSLQFDLAAHTYRFATVQGNTTMQRLPVAVRFGVLPRVQGPPGKPSATIDKAATFPEVSGMPTVSFMPNGKITVGSVYLIDSQQKCLGALTCSVSQVSYMRRYFYDDGKWKAW